MLPGEEEKIEKQVRDTEEWIDRKSSQYDIDNPRSPKESDRRITKGEDDKPEENGERHAAEDGKETDIHSHEDSKLGDTNSDSVAMPDASSQRHEQRQSEAQDTGEDGGDEVVEGEEDTVIY